MSEIQLDAFEYSITKIDDGFVFEAFAQAFLSVILGCEFVPVGGSKDKGVDGFEHIFQKESSPKSIFQISTEVDVAGKINNTINKLRSNKIDFDRLLFVSNRKLNNQDKLIDSLTEAFKVPITIYSLKWFVSNATYSEGTINAYNTFVESYFHEFNKPGKGFVVGNLDQDSRLYVFLRQQVEEKRDDFQIDEILTDTLILYALEETNPEKEVFKTKDEIVNIIEQYVNFDFKVINELVEKRVEILTKSPKQIQYHPKVGGYCLPYETRLKIQSRNLSDQNLVEIFQEQTEKKVRKYLKEVEISVRNLTELIDETIQKIYYQQGLEFSNFIVNGESKEVIEKDLQDIIGSVVDESSIIMKNKEKVKIALLMAIRDLVYNGSKEQKKYLQSLSNTYMMMFLLQWDPKLAIYFKTLSAKLNLFVCTSIIIPALSEYYLKPENKRHWNLLKAAKKAGISMYVNDLILNELISHFKMLRNNYYNFYNTTESLYLDSEDETLFIDQILIRAYFYAKMRGQVQSYEGFIGNFLDADLTTPKEDLISFLKDEFGIKYLSDEETNIEIEKDEKQKLFEKLKALKNSGVKAETDADIILTIYKLRDKNQEKADLGIWGYKTWWLSKDTFTYKAVIEALGEEKYPVSCYIRPDFIYNYIALTPNREEVDKAYSELFPSLLGVNLSFHIPPDINNTVKTLTREYGDKNPPQVKRILRKLGDKLKSDPYLKNKNAVTNFLDDEVRKLRSMS